MNGYNPTVFLKTTAKKKGRIFYINTNIKAASESEVQRLGNEWIIVSAAFLVEADGKYNVVLVERVPELKWALLPAGASGSVEELRLPSIALEREAQEELVLFRNGMRVCPIEISRMIMSSDVREVTIHDEANGKSYVDLGEVWKYGRKWFFMRCYLIKCDWRELHFCDGEKDELTKKYLNRRVALVPVDSLHGKVKPLAVYRGLKKISFGKIDLNGLQAPTLEWFRTRSRSYIEALQERC